MGEFHAVGSRSSEDLPEVPDVENWLQDLGVDEEKLEEVSKAAFESLESMQTRLSQVEDRLGKGKRADAIHEQLSQAMGGASLEEDSEQDYRKAIAEIEELNQSGLAGKAEWMVALTGTAFGTGAMAAAGVLASSGVGTVAGAGVAGATGVAAAISVGKKAIEEADDANSAIDNFELIASKIAVCRQEFDDIWSKLDDEEPEDRPEL